MMAQNDLVVVGIDVAKDKVDACIRSLSQRQSFPSTSEGRRALIRWLRKHKVGKAAMEASGGYERDWAKALREAGIEVRIVDPKRVRSFARSAGRLAKNDAIDAQMIAWFADIRRGYLPGPRRGTREVVANRICAPSPARCADRVAKQERTFGAGRRAEGTGAALEEDSR